MKKDITSAWDGRLSDEEPLTSLSRDYLAPKCDPSQKDEEPEQELERAQLQPSMANPVSSQETRAESVLAILRDHQTRLASSLTRLEDRDIDRREALLKIEIEAAKTRETLSHIIDKLSLVARQSQAEEEKIRERLAVLEHRESSLREKMESHLQRRDHDLKELGREQRHLWANLAQKGGRGLFLTVLLLVLTGSVNSYFESRAHATRQAYDAKATLLKSIVDEFSSMETEARQIQWDIADLEASEPIREGDTAINEGQARIYIDKVNRMIDKLDGMMLPPDWGSGATPQGEAKLEAWFRLYALSLCIDQSSLAQSYKGAKKEFEANLADVHDRGKLSEDQVAKMNGNIPIDPPCADHFEPEIFQELKTFASSAAWHHFGEAKDSLKSS